MAGTIGSSIVIPALDEAGGPVDGRGQPDQLVIPGATGADPYRAGVLRWRSANPSRRRVGDLV